MPTLNFKEIPEPHLSSGDQDAFEFFSRDFLEHLGYKILEGPDRGIDGGRDLIVLEVRKGIGGETNIKWLVSCKHKAHSGKSVLLEDEKDILDRVESKKCHGFIGFYSTLASAPLSSKLDALKSKIETQIFDREKIEGHLVNSTAGLALAQRYFPASTEKWRVNRTIPVLTAKSFEPNNEECVISTWDIVIWENEIESLNWYFNSELGTAELFCKSKTHLGQLARIQLSHDDIRSLRERKATPILWRYYEPQEEDHQNKDGVIKLQYVVDEKRIISFYKINYAKCNLLLSKLRELVEDWDE